MEPTPVALCGTLDIRPGNAEPLRVFLQEEARAVRAEEPGTIDFCFFVDEARSRLRWFESYLDATAFATHIQNAQKRGFLDALGGFGQLVDLDAFGPVDPLAHRILDAMGARFWERLAGFDRSVGHILTR